MVEFPGEKLLLKVLDLLEKGVGTYLRPWTEKRGARAKAIADVEVRRITRLGQEQFRNDLRAYRAGQKVIGPDYKLIEAPLPKIENSPEQDVAKVADAYRLALAEAAKSPLHLIEFERKLNLDQVALLALEEAAADKDTSANDAPVDPDWFAQWRNHAQDVSNEQMQRLWARVLKDEAKGSGTYSIHTLQFLSRMSQADAELIASLGNFVIGEKAAFSQSGVLKNTIEFDKLLYLSGLGILSGVYGMNTIHMQYRISGVREGRNFMSLRFHDKAMLVTPKNHEQTVIIMPAYAISIIGSELLKLAKCEAKLEYIKEVADYFRNTVEKIEIGVIEGNQVIDIKPF